MPKVQINDKSTPKRVPSIKQVLFSYNKRSTSIFVRTPFYTPCMARYSVLHLFGVLSGGNEPTLCKGRWLAKQDGGIVKVIFHQQTIPQSTSLTAPFTQGSHWFVRPESPSAFPDKHCFCVHKSYLLRLVDYCMFCSLKWRNNKISLC